MKLDHNYEVKVVNKKHPKHKQITKLVNISVENGFKHRTGYLYANGFILFYYLFERLSNSNVFNQVKYEINKKRDKITLDELSNLFVLFFAVFPCLFVVFIIECTYYKFKNNLSWL